MANQFQSRAYKTREKSLSEKTALNCIGDVLKIFVPKEMATCKFSHNPLSVVNIVSCRIIAKDTALKRFYLLNLCLHDKQRLAVI